MVSHRNRSQNFFLFPFQLTETGNMEETFPASHILNLLKYSGLILPKFWDYDLKKRSRTS